MTQQEINKVQTTIIENQLNITGWIVSPDSTMISMIKTCMTEYVNYSDLDNKGLINEFPKWVSVNDMLPESEQKILTLLHNSITGDTSIQIIRFGVRFFVGVYDPTERLEVTHWMPLPSKP